MVGREERCKISNQLEELNSKLKKVMEEHTLVSVLWTCAKLEDLEITKQSEYQEAYERIRRKYISQIVRLESKKALLIAELKKRE